jgi:hypothetical protein
MWSLTLQYTFPIRYAPTITKNCHYKFLFILNIAARFQVFTTMKIPSRGLPCRDTCSHVVGYQLVTGPCWLHIQGEVKSSKPLVSYHVTLRHHNPQDHDLNNGLLHTGSSASSLPICEVNFHYTSHSVGLCIYVLVFSADNLILLTQIM